MNRVNLILIISLLVFPEILKAQNQEEFKLEDFISYALTHNAELQNANLKEHEAKWKTKEIASNGLPHANINGTYSYYIDRPTQILPGELMGMPGQDLEVQFGKTNNANANLEVNQLIFSKPWITGLQTAKKAQELYSLVSLETKEDIIYRVSELYYNILINQAQLNTISFNINRMEALLQIIELQYNGNIAKKSDVDRVKVNITNLNTQKHMINDGINKQIYLMKVLCGIPSEKNIVINNQSINKEQLSIMPISNYFNPETKNEIQIINKQIELNHLELKNINSGYYPSLYGFGQFGIQAQRNEFNFFDTDENWYNMNMVGLKLEIPIFDGFHKATKTKQAKIRLEILETNKYQTNNYLTAEFKTASESLNTNLLLYQTQKENKELALEVYTQTTLQYKEGIAGLTDLLNAEASLMEAETLFNQAILRYKIAELDLLKARGELY